MDNKTVELSVIFERSDSSASKDDTHIDRQGQTGLKSESAVGETERGQDGDGGEVEPMEWDEFPCTCDCHRPGSAMMHCFPCCINGVVRVPRIRKAGGNE